MHIPKILALPVELILDVQPGRYGVVQFFKVGAGVFHVPQPRSVEHGGFGNLRQHLLFSFPVKEEAEGNTVAQFHQRGKPRRAHLRGIAVSGNIQIGVKYTVNEDIALVRQVAFGGRQHVLHRCHAVCILIVQFLCRYVGRTANRADLGKERGKIHRAGVGLMDCRVQGLEQKLVVPVVPQDFQAAVIQILIRGFRLLGKLPGYIIQLRCGAGIGEDQVKPAGDDFRGRQIINELHIFHDHFFAGFVGFRVVIPFHLCAVGVDVGPLGRHQDLQERRRNLQIAGQVVEDILLFDPGFQIEVSGKDLQHLDVAAVLGNEDALPDVHHRDKALCPVWKPAPGHDSFPRRPQKQGFQVEPFWFLSLAFGF